MLLPVLAWGLHSMSNQPFRHIVITGRPGVAGASDTLQSLVELLQKEDVRASIDRNTASVLPKTDLPTCYLSKIPEGTDLILVIGGDGSLLDAARVAVDYDLPVVGIHRGRLGFLTDIAPDNLTQLRDVLAGQYIEERRFLLVAEVLQDSRSLAMQIALNDVVIHPGDEARMIEFETQINNEFVHNQRADGMIVATPTGSTAYALSGGGPIMHPGLNAIVLVPMFPHTLSSRPLVVAGDSDVKIFIKENNSSSAFMSCDGHQRVEIPPGARVQINKKTKHLRLIHPLDYNYYATLRGKLSWENYANRK